ncbi:hypothetical protein P170DRAFT_426941 [Aspergillus steynii IBT 23096]|uniref:Bacteriophage T5 Orf172 DNA-binding domain-containing protein n=1 Tax=Aspergillus steynii IBT 23096 TaxID=1392250 RepID=A0A2I2G4A5_9EURO|nr:uncharacterized protein P170DRAFT_426941 [Aspergillus steynii IBT 23096]PLB47716.1 hypothetical protein P170DRAFT_426941 [Aspergillus steynii IBT 23096]
MGRVRSAKHTPKRHFGKDVPKSHQTPSSMTEAQNKVSHDPTHGEPVYDDSVDDELGDHGSSEHSLPIEIDLRRAETVGTVETSPSPSGRKAKRRTAFQETETRSDMARQLSRVIEQELTPVDEDSQDEHYSPLRDHFQQTHTEQFTGTPTQAEPDELAFIQQSLADPETPHQTPRVKKNKKSPLPPKNTYDAIERMSSVLKQGFDKTEKHNIGHAYLLEDTSSGTISPFKIGSAQKGGVKQREKQQIKKCGLQGEWHSKPFPQRPLRGYIRLELITHEQLYYMRHQHECQCKTDHREWFRGDKNKAREILEFWAKWLRSCEPYDSDGKLLPFWTARLATFEQRMDHYFKCLDIHCTRDNNEPITCQKCLQVGWKTWTEPTSWDHFRYNMLTPPDFPSIYFHLIFFLTVTSFLTSFIPVPRIIFLASILRILELITVGSTYFWTYSKPISMIVDDLLTEPSQASQDEIVKTPKKRLPAAQTPKSAPPILENDFLIVEESVTTPTGNLPPGQIPGTEPLLRTRREMERYSVLDESPSKGVQKRRRAKNSSKPLGTRDLNEALGRTFKSPLMPE